jgi:4-hydroxy-4-methyl-2-oxoglutarate aldolase
MKDREHGAPLDAIAKDLYTAVLSDVLDELGYPDQAMPPSIRPLDESLTMVGRARTGLYREVYTVVPGENPYALEIAPWGELLSTAARVRGAAGCLTDGFVRDIRQIRRMGFPVFHGGIAPLDSKGRGKVAEIDVPIRCAGVRVAPGDLVVGDADGVIVVPRAVESAALEKAFAKVQGENRTREALERGTSLAEVFARFQIL